MSTTGSQKLPGEASPTLPTFSYAQAAKGRSPSVPSLSSPGQITSETTGIAPSSVSLPNAKDVAAISVNGSAIEPSGEVHEKDDLNDAVQPNDLEVTPKNATSLLQSSTLPNSQPAASTPSSPSFETASTSTLPKEDELSSTANGSLDSNWDKNSQTSQNGSKPSERVEENKPQNSAAVWNDEGSTSAMLKEAPLPAVNIWQHRKEIQEARAKSKQVTAPHAPKLTTQFGASGTTNSSLKNPDSGGDLKKHENRKKVKSGSAYVEEKSSLGNVKEGSKPNEARTKGPEEGMFWISCQERPMLTRTTVEKATYRASRTPDTEKVASAVIAPPPPPGDAISWPTPDSAKGEEKKRAQERAEKGEKEKTPTTKSHGKEKWMPVPYVPSAVFSTPLPPTRRGGRTARGGRDGGARAGSNTQGNHGSEKASGPSGSHVSSATANANERNRGDSGPHKNGSSSRPKRSASAGPPTVREQRKITDTPQADRSKEGDLEPIYGPPNPSLPHVESRRTSSATQTEDLKGRRSSTTQRGVEYERNSTRAVSYTVDKEERYQDAPHDVYPHLRSTAPDRRSDNSSRSPEYTRDFHSQVPPRDRGEGRADRGRGAFRGRGAGNHGFPSSNQSSGQNFSHGHPPQHQASIQHQLPKSHSNHERHASQSHGAAYNTSQPASRAFRSGSRSHPVPHPIPYGRFPNTANGPHPGPPQLSSLQTDLANTYGYQPGQQGIMSAIPYNAYMEQISLFGMVSMQMYEVPSSNI